MPAEHVWLVVHGFLFLKVFSIYLYCMYRFDGSGAVLWLDPVLLALSLEHWFQGIHLLLGLGLLLSIWLRPLKSLGRLNVKRAVGLAVAFFLLFSCARLVHAWAGMAQSMLDLSVVEDRAGESCLSSIESAALLGGGESWDGFYQGDIGWPSTEPGWTVRIAASEEEGLVCRLRSDRYSEDGSLAERMMHTHWIRGAFDEEGGVFRLHEAFRHDPDRGAYLRAQRGEERWLIPKGQFDRFAAGALGAEIGGLLRAK